MPRRSIFFLIALILIFCFAQLNHSGSTNAQNQTREQPPPKPVTTEKTPPQTEKAPDYSQEAIVLEQLKMFYRFEKDGTGQRDLSVRVRVQSEAGLERFGQLVFAYSSANENFDVDFIRVRKADGTVINAAASDIQDLSAPIAREAPVYTDLRQKHVTVRGLRPGDVLEYHVVWRVHTPLAQNNFWLEQDFSNPESLITLDQQLEVNIPRDSKVKLKTAPGFDPNIREQDERRIYTWKYTNLKREDKDEKAESAKKKEEEEEPKAPQIQVTTFQSWDQVGQWYAGLERERIAPDEKIRAKTEELLRGRNSDKDKIEALYGYVAKNFRYVSLSLGQGRYQPHAAADVYANQYGDCKDKHTLLSSMLIAAGLRAFPALMNSSRKIDADVPSPGQFDHVITAIPVGGETLWMDTTSEVAPFRLIAPQLRDKKALLVPANAPARLETTPAEPPFLSTESLEMEGQVNELGKLSGHTHLAVRGDSELLFRLMFRRTPKSDWKNLRYYLSLVSGIRGQEVSEIKPSEPAAFEKPFEVDYDFTSDDFLDWSSRKTKLAIPLPSLRLAEVAADKQEGSKPIPLGPPIDITYRVKLSLPSQYQTRLPLPLTVKRDYADYSSTYKLEGNTLVAERKFRLREHELPAARVQDFRAFVAAVRADEAQTISMETSVVAGTPSIPSSVKVEELVQAAYAASKNSNYPLAEELLKRVIEKEPKNKEARRQLGWALFEQRKFEAAIATLREQTVINPFDDYSYNLLGRIYWQQQKYQEAEIAFRKQIEITPLDKWSHGNLGQMLVEWRKYKEAVPELEQAISLNPEEESHYVSLGRAYLNLSDTVKASEAFDKAVKLAPGQRVWNDVAYFLAVGNVQLDKAQQYAESAVTAVATDLRNVELEGLTVQNLQDVSSLGADWDTLGWVYFQKGNLDTAEKYITAAWFLGQHSEVGYHLGQILEKRGKSEEAIRMYALASVANRLVPEARESLDRLAGKDKSEALMKQAKDQLSASYTLKLGSLLKNLKENAEAEFYVVLVPGPAGNAQVAEVKFIRGDEKLRPLADALKRAKYNLIFPDEIRTKLIRRGTLLCQTNGQCSFLMLRPEYVTSVN
jgi:tetratricopeptide (TPR) repeat protein